MGRLLSVITEERTHRLYHRLYWAHDHPWPTGGKISHIAQLQRTEHPHVADLFPDSFNSSDINADFSIPGFAAENNDFLPGCYSWTLDPPTCQDWPTILEAAPFIGSLGGQSDAQTPLTGSPRIFAPNAVFNITIVSESKQDNPSTVSSSRRDESGGIVNNHQLPENLGRPPESNGENVMRPRTKRRSCTDSGSIPRRSTRHKPYISNPVVIDQIFDLYEGHGMDWDDIAARLADGTRPSALQEWYESTKSKDDCQSPISSVSARNRNAFIDEEDSLLMKLRREGKSWEDCRKQMATKGFPPRLQQTLRQRFTLISQPKT